MAEAEGLALIAELLGVDANELGLRITQRRTVSGRGSMTTIQLDEAKAQNNVAALIKYVYGAMFEFAVNKINVAHSTAAGEADGFIGILDIFGFEIFKKNSFEQVSRGAHYYSWRRPY